MSIEINASKVAEIFESLEKAILGEDTPDDDDSQLHGVADENKVPGADSPVNRRKNREAIEEVLQNPQYARWSETDINHNDKTSPSMPASGWIYAFWMSFVGQFRIISSIMFFKVAAAKRRGHEDELAKKRDMTAEERNRFDLANVKVKRNVQIDARTADGEKILLIISNRKF
jgi:hypothetical protein